MNGVITDLTEKAIEVGKNYAENLTQATQKTVSETLDVKPLVDQMAQFYASTAFRVDISQAARQKTTLSR